MNKFFSLIVATTLLAATAAPAQEAPAPAAAQVVLPPGPAQVRPDWEASVSLPLGAWNAILQGLAELPKKLADPIDAELRKQVAPQIEALQKAKKE